MKPERANPDTTLDTIPPMHAWVTSTRAKTPEGAAFLLGAALAHLDLVVGRDDVPQALLRESLALRAAEACVGRCCMEREDGGCSG